MSCTFGALVYGSVWLVLPWLVLVPQLISLEQAFLSGAERAAIPHTVLLAFGVSGAAVALVGGFWPPTSALFFLVLWALAECIKALWQHAKERDGSVPLQLGVRRT